METHEKNVRGREEQGCDVRNRVGENHVGNLGRKCNFLFPGSLETFKTLHMFLTFDSWFVVRTQVVQYKEELCSSPLLLQEI